jgi:outer membrane protein assembly factor BamE (lipoprotein component of BamABCDE complex)
MKRILFLSVAVSLVLGTGGCASGGSAGDGMPSQVQSAPPVDSKLARIRAGMSDYDVRRILGRPDESSAYLTGKARIPFYYGSDTHRSDWMYKGVGRVIFSRNRYSGALSVVQILHDPNELM